LHKCAVKGSAAIAEPCAEAQRNTAEKNYGLEHRRCKSGKPGNIGSDAIKLEEQDFALLISEVV